MYIELLKCYNLSTILSTGAYHVPWFTYVGDVVAVTEFARGWFLLLAYMYCIAGKFGKNSCSLTFVKFKFGNLCVHCTLYGNGFKFGDVLTICQTTKFSGYIVGLD